MLVGRNSQLKFCLSQYYYVEVGLPGFARDFYCQLFLFVSPQDKAATVGMFDNVLFDNSKLIMFDW